MLVDIGLKFYAVPSEEIMQYPNFIENLQVSRTNILANFNVFSLAQNKGMFITSGQMNLFATVFMGMETRIHSLNTHYSPAHIEATLYIFSSPVRKYRKSCCNHPGVGVLVRVRIRIAQM